jgi:Tol biopolymer transport system component
VREPDQAKPELGGTDAGELLPEDTPTPAPAAPERVVFIAAERASPDDGPGGQIGLWSVPAAGGDANQLAENVEAHSFSEREPWSFSATGGGQKLAFVQGPRDEMRLMSVDLGSGSIREVLASSDGWWLASPSFSPDGQRLALLNIQPPPSGEFHDSQYGTVYVVRADDGDVERTFERAAIWTPMSWSPGGEWLAAVEAGGGTRWPRLTLLPAGEGEPMEAPFARAWHGTWLPQGQQLLTTRGQPSGGIELMFWDVSTAEFQPFSVQSEAGTGLPDVVWGLKWSPDGRWLSGFVGDEWESLDLYAVRGEGGEPVQLFDEQGSTIIWSRWAPDSSHIAFIAIRGRTLEDSGDEEDVVDGFVVQPDGGGLWQVNVGLGGRVARMAWSPDGQRLAFALNSGEGDAVQGRLYTVGLQDRRTRLLHEELGQCFYLLWLPAL